MNHALVGVHADMAAEDYHALPGASASQLRRLWQSTPAHLKASLEEPRDPTAAMLLGTLAHSVILEPDKPLPGIVIQPLEYEPGKKWTYAAKLCKEWRAAQEMAGLLVLSADEYNGVFGMALAVAEHPDAAPLLSKGQSELSLVTFDATNNVPVRARLDFVPDAAPFLVDLKTTNDAAPRAFKRKATADGLHIQAALYLDLWNALTGEQRTGFRFIAVEQKPPHAVKVFDCSPEFIAQGREDYRRTLTIYGKCVAEDSWPAYPLGLEPLDLERWAVL